MRIIDWIQIVAALVVVVGGVFMLAIDSRKPAAAAVQRRKRLNGIAYVLLGIGLALNGLDNYGQTTAASLLGWSGLGFIVAGAAVFAISLVGKGHTEE